MDDFLRNIDKSKFVTSSYNKRVKKPWGYEEHLTPPESPYMLKLIYIKAGKRLSLQVHDQKQESWIAISGDCRVILEDSNGKLQEIKIGPGESYSCAIGQKHRLAAGEKDAVIAEASTPEIGTTYRLEDDYGRPHETEQQRAKERNE